MADIFRTRFFLSLGLLMGTLVPDVCRGHDDGTPHQHAPSGAAKHAGVMTSRSSARTLPPPKEEDVFHFVIYGDRTGGVPAGLKVLEQAVDDTNLIDPDLVMTVGDLIQGYNETPQWLEQMKEFKAIMGRLNMKWFPVAGNHDVYWRGEGRPPAGHHESNYEKHFGPLWYSFEHKQSGFIVLYSDEGNRQTNRKGFNTGSLQKMSDEQLAFLDKALEQMRTLDQVFVFLHHPRWIGKGYTGGNWDLVHNKLVRAGNVSAVFAGHIHHMRFDGPKDGIEYYTLATTGGSLQADIPDAGYLHHFNLVTVRKDRVSVAALPVGSIIDPKDFTPAFLDEVGLARTIRANQQSPPLMLDSSGRAAGKVTFSLNNPCPREISATVSLEPAAQWSSSLQHAHLEVAPGQTKQVTFDLQRNQGHLDQASLPAVELQMEYVGQSARIQLPRTLTPISVGLSDLPADFFDHSKRRCLLVKDDQSAVRVNSRDVRMPPGPMTLEAWVRPNNIDGFQAIIAKTQNSEYSFFCNQGVPQFDIHLGGRYVSAKAQCQRTECLLDVAHPDRFGEQAQCGRCISRATANSGCHGQVFR
ncbi:MAG: metallophosphoesterase, partial [Pirellulales bacterium]|nr:metallophosphoesterase [Pirellulales bacterium]